MVGRSVNSKPTIRSALYASTLSDHSHYLCNCLSCCKEMTSAQASGLWIYYIVHVCILVFEATKIKFKPTPRVSSWINPEMCLTPPRWASSGLYDTLDVVTKNFPDTLGTPLGASFSPFHVHFVSSKNNNKVRKRLNNFKYFHIFLYVFASSVKGRPITQNSKNNYLH